MMRRVLLALAGLALSAQAPTPTPARSAAPSMAAPLWIASPSFRRANLAPGERVAFDNETVWQTIRVGAAARRIRLRLSNELGDERVALGSVTLVHNGRAIPVRFASATGAALGAGEVLLSDPIAIELAAFDAIDVGVHYPRASRPVGARGLVRVAPGTGTVAPAATPVRGPMIVTAAEDVGSGCACGRVIVALGDSITEGVGAAPGNDWPSRLARRLGRARCAPRVLNAGIGGNRLLSKGASPSLLSRFDRDVLAIPSVTDIILLEGINDVRNWATGPAVEAGDARTVLHAYRQIVARAHAHGIRVIGGTITPHRGATNQTDDTLATVAAVNDAIRRGEIFDGWIDFAAAIADPATPDRMRAEASSGDWLHPSDRGYELMAAAIPLTLFYAPLPRGR